MADADARYGSKKTKQIHSPVFNLRSTTQAHKLPSVARLASGLFIIVC